MNLVQSLSLRTATALTRLADLERRASQIASGEGKVVRPALRELSSALEELQVANEHLQSQVNELLEARESADRSQAILEEFEDAMPMACVWTDDNANIRRANSRAGALFNVARDRLAGKPLMLFVTDRQALFDSVRRMREAVGGETVEMCNVLRPRERHPRPVEFVIRRMERTDFWCWFVRENPPIAAAAANSRSYSTSHSSSSHSSGESDAAGTVSDEAGASGA
jgi:PAS domain-containing protein